MTKARVLFVDDEPRILDGLRRSLRGQRGEWDMSFAPGGEAALELLAGEAYDVVVSDMRMPGMDGAELLTRVSQHHPEVARVVLSGHTEREAAIKVALAGHRFLPKPTETEALITVIGQLVVRTCPDDRESVWRIARSTGVLPALPAQTAELDALLGADEVDHGRLVRAVVHDTGLTAKLLQLSNSGFYGPRPKNASVSAVVNAMGVPTIGALVAASRAHQASVTWPPEIEGQLRAAWLHAVASAHLVEKIASPAHCPHAQAAALLQNIGRLAAIAGGSAVQHGVTPTAAEPAAVAFGEVGVELLRLWGLPAPIVTAVGQRDLPQHPEESGLGVVGALRVAHLLVRRNGCADSGGDPYEEELDRLLAHPQMAAQSIDWHGAAQRACAQAGEQLAP